MRVEFCLYRSEIKKYVLLRGIRYECLRLYYFCLKHKLCRDFYLKSYNDKTSKLFLLIAIREVKELYAYRLYYI